MRIQVSTTARISDEKRSKLRVRKYSCSWYIRSESFKIPCARSRRTRARHVKPHGALYNMAVRDQETGRSHCATQSKRSIRVNFVCAQTNSAMERAGEKARLQIAREIFADRNYLNDGWLVPRTRPDALLRDPKEAAERVLRMLREGKVRSVEGRDVEVRGETICVHGDTPGAVEFARELRSRLEHEGVRISAPQSLL